MSCRAQELPRKFCVADQGSAAPPAPSCGNTDTTTENVDFCLPFGYTARSEPTFIDQLKAVKFDKTMFITVLILLLA